MLEKSLNEASWGFLGIGGIAQLGERLHGMQEVSSSILLTSTKNFCGETEKSSKLRRKSKGFDPIV